ncbi:IS1595 family transposase [Pseudodesulfovibrio sp.]|nr:IS1595 family transposase [Pseudodesulfovibrio sp.]
MAHETHFLLEARARKISLRTIAEWDYETVWSACCKLRWPETDGAPVCPQCGILEHYFIKTREQWRCKGCNHTFSLTSGTWLSSTKLDLKTILIGIVVMTNAVKGLSALELSRHMDVQYKTAFVFYHKLRDVLYQTRDEFPALKYEVEIDGAYIYPSLRDANKKEDRPTKSRLSKRPKQCILVMRMRDKDGVGASRTLTFIIEKESAAEVMDKAEQHITQGTKVITDQHRAYSDLIAYFDHIQVNHDLHYVRPDGENTNQAESYFSRFRRFVRGQAHQVGADYLYLYANEIAYREDTRRWDNRQIAFDLLGKMLSVKEDDKKPRFRGYWNQTTRNCGGDCFGLAA